MSGQRGICPGCGEERQLTKAGVMRLHLGGGPGEYWRDNCEGSGQPPKALAEDPIAAAEARGYQRAIDALREYAEHIAGYGEAYQHAADYLASLAPKEPDHA